MKHDVLTTRWNEMNIECIVTKNYVLFVFYNLEVLESELVWAWLNICYIFCTILLIAIVWDMFQQSYYQRLVDMGWRAGRRAWPQVMLFYEPVILSENHNIYINLRGVSWVKQ